MKLMVASDIHGSAFWCRRMLEAFDREAADRLLLLGDILYHGPRNPLPEGHAPMEVASMLNERTGRIFAVRGNCDAEIDQMVLHFPIMADYALLCIGERLIVAAHGHILPALVPGDILLQGHTHLPSWEHDENGVLVLNPGSVSIPKNGAPHAYLLLEEGGAEWKTTDSEVFHRIRF